MNHFSLEFIKTALQNRNAYNKGSLANNFFGFSINSKTTKPGEVFVALKGERLDGHDFLEEAFQNGATLAIVSQSYEPKETQIKYAFFFVDDTLKAFHDIAHHHLQMMPAKRVALTGSSGKTTTKELIRCAILGSLNENALFTSKGNQNNHFGVPLSALSVTSEHQMAVFEMGMNHFGEITELCQIVKPQIGLITNIGTAHAGNLGGIEGVAKAKAELFESLSQTDIAIINADDSRITKEANLKAKCPKISFGKSSWADVHIESIESSFEETIHIKFSYQNIEQYVALPLLGEHNAQNAAAAVAVCIALQLDFNKSVQGLATIKPIYGRLEKKFLANGTLILDDTYNANPDSMKVGLSVLASFRSNRLIAVLGEMAELGNEASSFHEAVGAFCHTKNIPFLFACGENAKHYGEGAIKAGMPKEHFFWAPNSTQLAELVASQIQSNDIILVKGSRITQMEKVIEKLCSLST